MNFHKTIGFLAAFLLMVGLGAPDSFAQEVTVRVSPGSVDEGETDLVTVSVTLSEEPGADNTVSIAIALTSEDGAVWTLAPADDPDGPDPGVFPPIVIGGTDKTGRSILNVIGTQNTTYNHPEKKVVTVATTTTTSAGSPPTYTEGMDTFTINEDEDPIGALSLSAAPPSLTLNGTAETILTVSVKDDVEVALPVTFVVSTGEGLTAPDIAVGENSTSGTLTVSDVTAVGTVTVTASAVGYEDAMLDIQIIDRTADDIEGFRVTLRHDDGAWVGFGKKKVKVDVTRLNNSAYPWERFENIVVALRDTVPTVGRTDGGGNATENIFTLTASGFSLDSNGDLAFSKAASAGGDLTKDSNITYSLADDRLTFEFQLVQITDTTDPANGTDDEAIAALGNVGTRAADGTVTVDDTHSRHGDTAKGQRRGVYATAIFTPPGGGGGTINSNDDESEVFSSPAALANVDAGDQKVGDGNLIRIDLIAPENAATGNLEVTDKDGDDLDEDAMLKIDSEINIAVNVDQQVRFRDASVRIEVKTLEVEAQNDDTVVGKAGTSLHKEEFTQSDVVDEVGEALETSFTLDAGSIVVKAKAKSKTRDGEAIASGATFEPDNVPIRISVVSTDQAGNPSAAVNHDLIADTRKPVIEVFHPTSDDSYFSGLYEDSDSGIDDYLKPLKIRVDEDLQSLHVYINDKQQISLWGSDPGSEADESLSEVVGEAVESVGDTIVYNTSDLVIDNKATPTPTSSADNPGGSKKKLVLMALDKVGNKTKLEIPNVTHDDYEPMIAKFFPNNADLEGDDNLINADTRHPVITLPEAVDSVAVVYDGSSGKDITESVSGFTPVQDLEVPITKDLVQDRKYTLTIFVRDLAGNAFRTDNDLARNLKYDAQFDNPKANKFTVTNRTGNNDPKKASAGVIAGQAFLLDIQAVDSDDPADADADTRPAVTYRNKDEDGNPASEVRISAQDMNGDLVSSVWFEGDGVMDDADNPDGMATLDAGAWRLGSRRVFAKSNKIADDMTILVEHRNAGGNGTSTVAFKGSAEGLYVDAADFNKFNLIALEDGVPVDEIWGAFTLRVVPADRHGNPSVKAFRSDPEAAADSLKLLDGDKHVDKKVSGVTQGFNYKNGIRASLISAPPIGSLVVTGFQWTIPLKGAEFPLVAPSDISQVSVQAAVVNASLDPDDARSKNIISTTDPPFTVQQPVDISITLWVPGMEGDQAGNDVTIPAGGSVDVTARAEGLNEGDTVTFNVDGTETEETADADGYAGQPITLSGSGTVSVTASVGQYSASLDITHTEQAGRRSFTDSNGDPVYLVDLTDNTVNENDITAFVGAYLSSAGDANYNPQADADDSGTVDDDDLALIVTSWLKTADNGPATKPLVLSGLNANAEFALNLGSERVLAGELVAVDVSLANVESLMGYGFTLNYDATKFEFVSFAPADENLLTSTGGETLSHHVVTDGQVQVVTGMYNGTAVSGGGDIVRFVFRVLYEFEDNARFEIADGLVFDPSNLSNPAVVAGVLELQSTPREFALHQNFPNPFNPDTTIKYDLAESADVTLQIYNVLGQVVRTLVASEVQNAGRYQIRWNGMDERGVPVSSGIYFYQISADGKFSDVRKLMLLK